MPVNEAPSIVSPVEKKDIMQRIVLGAREKEEREPKLILLTSTRRKACYTKEVKPKGAEWP
jgi:hypothetical protein